MGDYSGDVPNPTVAAPIVSGGNKENKKHLHDWVKGLVSGKKDTEEGAGDKGESQD